MSNNRVIRWLSRHPLLESLISLRGNQRACIYPEPLWGIPAALYTPYATLYMSALGVSDTQIGLILSVGTFLMMLTALMGGIITDRLGRRRTTFFADIISWSLPCLLWAFSQNFWWFFAAMVFNSVWEVSNVSWTCLLVEGADTRKLTDMYTWATISGLLSVFFAPVAGWLVSAYGVISAMRAAYVFAFVLMTAKFIIVQVFAREQAIGLARMAEAKGKPVFRQLFESLGVVKLMFQSARTRTLVLIMVLLGLSQMITNNFFGLLITSVLGVEEGAVAYFPMARAAMMLIFIFAMQPRLRRFGSRHVMLVGVGFYILAMLCLLLSASGSLWPLIPYVILDASAFALVSPRRDSLTAVFIDENERARMYGLLQVLTMLCTAPFGIVVGALSDVSRIYPFVLNMLIYVLLGAVIFFSKTLKTYEQ